MKNFAMRHTALLGFVIYGGFITLGMVASNIYHNNWFFLLYIPALLGLLGGLFLNGLWICVCPSCGEKNLNKNNRCCPKCGKPTLIRRKLRKICPNSHKIYDESDSYKNCPKCGKFLQPYN
jgi:hypothetical protein